MNPIKRRSTPSLTGRRPSAARRRAASDSAPSGLNDQLLENARRYEAGFGTGQLARKPRQKLAIVTCMDARIDPMRILGLEEGDAHVLRNAGGVVDDEMIRSLTISQRLVGTEAVMVVMHTDCGMHTADGEAVVAGLEAEIGYPLPWNLGTFGDLDDAVRGSVARIVSSPYLAHNVARGFVFDVATGGLREVPQHG